MYLFFSTFITGFASIIQQELPKTLKDVTIELLSDGLIIYKTESNLEEIKRVKFFNNSFILIKKNTTVSDTSVKDLLKDLLRDPTIETTIRNLDLKKNLKFRVRASIANQFIAINKNLLGKIESRIKNIAGLIVDRSLPEIEFQVIVRREGFGLIGIRFTRRGNYEKILEKGELYPELAYILCLISEPQKDDVFLDPFSGYGSIPMQRATSFPYKQVFAGDNDPVLAGRLRQRLNTLSQKIVLGKWDALNLRTFKDHSIDKIVTDPPWGLYSGNSNLTDFYSRMLTEFYRITKAGGIIVILTARKDLFESELGKFKGKFELLSQYNTLVSGKKARVYKINVLQFKP